VQARFVVIGDGHLRDELEELTSRLGLTRHFIFTGFREDATALYADLDIVALTSLNEGTPLTIIEGLGAGRVAMATEVGGVVDLMGERRETRDGFVVWDHGLTAPSRDVKAYARALRVLIEDAELRRTMGDCGRTFVRSRLSRQRLVGDVTELYHELSGAGNDVVMKNPNLITAADEHG
jgi:glycosyltransferase involved in cell wall biosynthesis